MKGRRRGILKIFLAVLIAFFIADVLVYAGWPGEFPQKTIVVYNPDFSGRLLAEKNWDKAAEILENKGIDAVAAGKIDPDWIKALHSRGIKYYAQLAVFFGEGAWQKEVFARPVLADGSFVREDDWYRGVCPCCRSWADKKVEEAARLAENYDIDGLWLDFIRWPTKWESKNPVLEKTCFCAKCLSRFQRESGIKIPQGLEETARISAWIYKNCPKPGMNSDAG